MANEQRSMKEAPGGLSHERMMDRIIRVDHAGEYGAKRIYEGQLAILRRTKSGPVIEEMKEQEQAHLDAFERLMKEKKARPTALLPVWHVGGFLLGAASALLGEKAAMACTVAVEETIEKHYKKQEDYLQDVEPAISAKISQFRHEEMEHHDKGLDHGAEQSPFYVALHGAVTRITKSAIWLSERI